MSAIRCFVAAFTVVAWLFGASGLAHAKAVQSPFKSADQIARWVHGYRNNPQPHLLPSAVKAFSRLGLLRDPDKAGLYLGFVGGVLADNQVKARGLIADMFPMSPADQYIIIQGIAYSGLPEWQSLLREFADRMPARAITIRKFLNGQKKPLFSASMKDEPATLDALWGYYIATGSYVPVQRIMLALPWSQDRSDVDTVTAGSVAKWTLAQNAMNDRGLLNFYKVELPYVGKTAKKPLEDVIQAAEEFETHKIRKTQVAAIQDVKVKQTRKPSKWAWASQAGATALSIGCVTASALGHPEVAAGCIVTGAIFQASTKIWELVKSKPK